MLCDTAIYLHASSPNRSLSFEDFEITLSISCCRGQNNDNDYAGRPQVSMPAIKRAEAYDGPFGGRDDAISVCDFVGTVSRRHYRPALGQGSALLAQGRHPEAEEGVPLFAVAKRTRAVNSKKLASVSHNTATNEIDAGIVLTAPGEGGWRGGTG